MNGQDGASDLALFTNWRWLVPLCVFVLGQSMEVVALNFASEAAVVAAGNFTLVWTILVSVLVFREPFSWRPHSMQFPECVLRWDLLNLVLLMGGTCVTVWFAPLIPNVSWVDIILMISITIECESILLLNLTVS